MATFQVDDEWIDIYRSRLHEFEKKYYWRCTSRIDTLDLKSIPKLSQIGLRVLDLGLESASPRQLKLMQKTNAPKDYLRKAEKMIYIAYESGIWVKLNILLSAGENYQTIDETKEWLNKNKKYIKGISSNCETIYGPHNNLIDSFKKLGASYVNENDLEEKGYSNINLSNEIDYNSAKVIAQDLSKNIMSAEDYYDLKSYGYFPRNYNKQQFEKDLNALTQDMLPFKI